DDDSQPAATDRNDVDGLLRRPTELRVRGTFISVEAVVVGPTGSQCAVRRAHVAERDDSGRGKEHDDGRRNGRPYATTQCSGCSRSRYVQPNRRPTSRTYVLNVPTPTPASG